MMKIGLPKRTAPTPMSVPFRRSGMDHDVAQRHRYSIELRIVAMQRCAFITGSLATNSTVRSGALSLQHK